MMNSGSSGSQFHDRKLMPLLANMPCCWLPTMSEKFRLPETISTTTITKPIGISYEIIWAEARIAPMNEYFEFDDQPAMMMPYTSIEVIASSSSRPALTSASAACGPNGTTTQAATAGMMVRI